MRKAQFAMTALVALGAAVSASAAGAQGTVASPFHAGQWAIEGYVAGQSGGILRFFTPRTALVFDLAADRVSTTSDDAGSLLRSNTGTELGATLGLRWHTMLAQHVASTFGAGVSGAKVDQKVEYAAPQGTSKYHSLSVGPYVELGGQYMVAEHFAIGLEYRLSARHVKSDGTSQSGSEFAAGFLPVRATLYF